MKKAIIVGAGPAGLTAAYELLRTTDVHPVVMEGSNEIGGISKTVEYNGNRIDIGGHRFFSKNDTVMQWWQDIMPLQNKPSKDEILLNIPVTLEEGNARRRECDPEQDDRVLLLRHRVSRIYYLRHFFSYPISLAWQTFANMGLLRTMKVGVGYLATLFHKLPETSLENFYINRFGKPLYRMFFEDYTEKVWGIHPSKLGSDWGSQRVKGISIIALILDVVKKKFRKANGVNQKDVETSLIEQFIYPKYGPGQLWTIVSGEIIEKGGEVLMNSPVEKINVVGNKVVSVVVNGDIVPCDYLISSMPIKDLVASLQGVDVPTDVQDIAAHLPYRDFITVGLLVDKMKIRNTTKIKTYANRVPDTWIYIQERDVKIGRLQIFNNWSPYMVSDFENKIWIGLEYFCTEGDEMWNASDEDFISMAIEELVKIDILESKTDVADSVRIKVKKAYPAYYGSYYQLDKVRTFLDSIENLYCVGRNGQHRYNNMDHSMLSAMEAVKNIKNGVTSKDNLWSVNTENEYHESK
ncbi:MAG: NAD(P)/FAD-dependent oxidoreductase [Bacteroidaceae bacterium]|nr:NAD(P)/FAD-dependent oxidoreductase [Bacteroidaceae bacterium]